MYTRRNIRWSVIARFSWWKLLVFTAWALISTGLYLYFLNLGIDISIPLAPVGTIGVAVALYVGFKNNQSYDRLWEARKIWGGIVNTSRTFANQVLSFVSAFYHPDSIDETKVEKEQRRLIYRHIAWINTLRYQLRRDVSFGFEPKGTAKKYMQPTDVEALKRDLKQLLPEEELGQTCGMANPATQLLRAQGEHLKRLVENECLTEDFRHIAMMDQITEMYTLQGKCERIKNTPFPRQYAYFATAFTYIFIVLLPLGIVGSLGERTSWMTYLTVPLSVIISWMFYTMDVVGDTSEDPFQNFINDVPMTALCRTIEIDLRQMLGESDIPPKITPVNDVLM